MDITETLAPMFGQWPSGLLVCLLVEAIRQWVQGGSSNVAMHRGWIGPWWSCCPGWSRHVRLLRQHSATPVPSVAHIRAFGTGDGEVA